MFVCAEVYPGRRDLRAREIFGSVSKDDDTSGGSRLWVSWAHIHDASDRPVDGLHPQGVAGDSVIDSARSLPVRDHVRIGHRGAAALNGKFEEAVVPAGHRFTFDLVLEADGETDRQALTRMLELLAAPSCRIGGSTRNGLGAFQVKSARQRDFDLTKPDDAIAFARLPVRLDEEPEGLLDVTPAVQAHGNGWRTLELPLEPEDYFAVNGSDPWLEADETDPPDFNPLREARIEWRDDALPKGRLGEPRLLIPGTAIKGALAHRVAYHANALAGHFADEVDPEEIEQYVGTSSPVVAYLFGSSADEGTAGRVFIEDVWLPESYDARTQRIWHTSLDRFTGGVRSGFLFDERVLFRHDPLPVRLLIDSRNPPEETSVALLSVLALQRALRDLAAGGLANGAGDGRGHGRFSVPGFDAAWKAFIERETR